MCICSLLGEYSLWPERKTACCLQLFLFNSHSLTGAVGIRSPLIIARMPVDQILRMLVELKSIETTQG